MAVCELSGKNVTFSKDDVIVSKTNTKGHITYVNQIFCSVSGFSEREMLGEPHSIIRHPAMPRCVFKLLWDQIAEGKEIFAYVVNKCKNGDYYWVFAHVTPSFGNGGKIVGYHSNRRSPTQEVIDKHIWPLYQNLLEIEKSYKNKKDGLAASTAKLLEILDEHSTTYDEFIFTLDPTMFNQEGGAA